MALRATHTTRRRRREADGDDRKIEGTALPYAGFGPGIARAEEIVAALKIYKAEDAQAQACCGYTAAADACERQEGLIADLVQRIASTPARTSEGVCDIAQAAIDASIFSGASLTEMLAERLLVERNDLRAMPSSF